MGKQKKSDKHTVEKVMLVTAILNLIRAIIEMLE